jgi:Beta-ketoacyl synthase, N-terminal domain
VSSSTAIACVDGVAFWSPRLPGWDVASAVLAGIAEAPAATVRRPAPALLPPTERRRAPDTVALAIEVAARACAAAAMQPAELASVFATTHGDLAITDYLCANLLDSPLHTSPTRFHNSVHNAAAGYWCIAVGCHAPYTTVSVAGYSFGAGLLEALAQLASRAKPVLFVAYDAEATGPLASLVSSSGLVGAALVLAPRRSSATVAELRWSLGREGPPRVTGTSPQNASLVSGNAMASALPLFETLARHSGMVTLAVGPSLSLRLQIPR